MGTFKAWGYPLGGCVVLMTLAGCGENAGPPPSETAQPVKLTRPEVVATNPPTAPAPAQIHANPAPAAPVDLTPPPPTTDPAPATPAHTDAADGWATPDGRFVLRAKAKGVQIYKATPGTDGKLAWTLVGPEAELTDALGQPVGRHFKGPDGPTWECADGSRVVGKKLRDRPSPNPDSIPELQLEGHPSGAGELADVDFVERLTPTGGQPPPLTPDTKPNDEARIPYTADYIFYAGPGAGQR